MLSVTIPSKMRQRSKCWWSLSEAKGGYRQMMLAHRKHLDTKCSAWHVRCHSLILLICLQRIRDLFPRDGQPDLSKSGYNRKVPSAGMCLYQPKASISPHACLFEAAWMRLHLVKYSVIGTTVLSFLGCSQHNGPMSYPIFIPCQMDIQTHP